MQTLELLEQYKNSNAEEYEKAWSKYDAKLYKYEANHKDFKDWAVQNDKFGRVSIWIWLEFLDKSI